MHVPPLACENCGCLIGALETPCCWRDKIVCLECHTTLAPSPAVTVACPACHAEHVHTLVMREWPAVWVFACPACGAVYRVSAAFDVALIERPKVKRREWFTPRVAE